MSWAGCIRSDGFTVAPTAEGKWIVLPSDGQPRVTACPCCKRELRTAEAARRVCDTVYPEP